MFKASNEECQQTNFEPSLAQSAAQAESGKGNFIGEDGWAPVAAARELLFPPGVADSFNRVLIPACIT